MYWYVRNHSGARWHISETKAQPALCGTIAVAIAFDGGVWPNAVPVGTETGGRPQPFCWACDTVDRQRQDAQKPGAP